MPCAFGLRSLVSGGCVGFARSVSEVDGPSARYRGRPAFEGPVSRALYGWRSLEGSPRDPVARLTPRPPRLRPGPVPGERVSNESTRRVAIRITRSELHRLSRCIFRPLVSGRIGSVSRSLVLRHREAVIRRDVVRIERDRLAIRLDCAPIVP